MQNLRSTIYISLIAAVIGAVGLHQHYWSQSHPPKDLRNVIVCDIKGHPWRSDLGFTGIEYLVQTPELYKPIEFSEWDNNIKQGNLVDMKVQEGYTLFGLIPEHLDGVSVKKVNLPGLF